MSTILVTGATGKVGRRLVPRLLAARAANERIRVLVRRPEDAEQFAALGAEPALGDLREQRDRSAAVAGADVVVNSAATFRGGVTEAEMDAVNRDAAVELGRDAATAGVRRFIQLSTNLVYGPGRGRPAREDDELLAEGGYPGSKRAAEEQLARISSETGLGLVVLRLAFVYGEGDSHLRDFLPMSAGMAAHRRLGSVHHADVGQAVIRAVRTPGIEGRVYNVSDDAQITVWDAHVLCGVELAADRPSSAVSAASASAETVEDPWSGVTDTARIRAELGFRPFYPTAWSAHAVGAL